MRSEAPEYDHLGEPDTASQPERWSPPRPAPEGSIERRDETDPSEFVFDDEEGNGGEMGFFDHLEELRSRIIKSLVALIITSSICAFYLDQLIENVLLGPAHRMTPPLVLRNFEPMGQITLALQVVLICGLILAIPFILWQFWQFVRPGLYKVERRMALYVGLATIVCFLTGVVFAYFVLVPTSLQVTTQVAFHGIENAIGVSSYFSMVLGLILVCGVVFEMPMLSYALARFGLVTSKFLRTYRRHAAVVILIAAAVITPTADPVNQLLLAVPLYALYEISILVAKTAGRQHAESLRQANAEQ